MPYFNQSQTFLVDPAILAFSDGNHPNVSATVQNTYVSLNTEARKQVPAGLFVAQVGNVLRFLPRTKLTAVTATGATSVTATPTNIFVAGDVLTVVEPYSVLTVTTVTAAQTVTVTVLGITATATATTSNTTTTASEVATAINATAGLSDIVRALSITNKVFIFAVDGLSNHGITTAGTVTSAALSSATLVLNATAVGTIASIDYTTGVITLTGNASVALPIGANIGVRVNAIVGLHVHAVDYTVATAKDLALYTIANGVRIQYLPYFDGDIDRRFPLINFAYKF